MGEIDTLVTQNLPPDSGIEHWLWGSCSIAPRKSREVEALMRPLEDTTVFPYDLGLVEYT